MLLAVRWRSARGWRKIRWCSSTCATPGRQPTTWNNCLGGYVDTHGAAQPVGALLFSCLGRGLHLYGHPDHDTRRSGATSAMCPRRLLLANGEIGPVQGTTFLHGYTSSFGLFRSRQ